ncbi:MAG: hypothetical protein VX725_04130, partial [Actinomycetota bacterium]|nr:hypothetical protein [Actinomycetota bacterium]
MRTLTDHLLEDQSREIGLEELVEAHHRTDDGGYSLDSLLTAAQTIPFLTESRVVVGRDMGAFSKKELVKPLLEYLSNPLSSTRLVLVWEKGPNLHR